jgi:RNA-directed DNA polymerase
MSDRRPKNQRYLAFPAEARGEAPNSGGQGTESLAAKRPAESPVRGERWREEICEQENGRQAWARVKANQGSSGVDGMTVQELPGYLKQHGPTIRDQLLGGTYVPQPVKRVEIPKPEGGVRKLGVGKDLAAQTAGSAHGPWRLANSPALAMALPNAYFDSLGIPRLTVG